MTFLRLIFRVDRPFRLVIGVVIIVAGLVLWEHGFELVQGDPVNQASCRGGGCPAPYYGEYLEMTAGVVITLCGALYASVRGSSSL